METEVLYSPVQIKAVFDFARKKNTKNINIKSKSCKSPSVQHLQSCELLWWRERQRLSLQRTIHVLTITCHDCGWKLKGQDCQYKWLKCLFFSPHWEEPAEVFRASGEGASRTLRWRDFSGMSNWGADRHLAGREQVLEEGGLEALLRLLPPWPNWMSRSWWMDGWCNTGA